MFLGRICLTNRSDLQQIDLGCKAASLPPAMHKMTKLRSAKTGRAQKRKRKEVQQESDSSTSDSSTSSEADGAETDEDGRGGSTSAPARVRVGPFCTQ
jgi:hypothetical protein